MTVIEYDEHDGEVLQPRAYSGGFGIPMPDPDDLCEMCGDRVGRPQVCTSDRARHRHGMIHARTRDFHLTWVCNECREVDANAEVAKLDTP